MDRRFEFKATIAWHTEYQFLIQEVNASKHFRLLIFSFLECVYSTAYRFHLQNKEFLLSFIGQWAMRMLYYCLQCCVSPNAWIFIASFYSRLNPSCQTKFIDIVYNHGSAIVN